MQRSFSFFIHEYSRNKHEIMDVMNRVLAILSTNIHEIDTKIGRGESRPYNIFIHEYSRNEHEIMDVVNRVPIKPSIPHTLNS